MSKCKVCNNNVNNLFYIGTELMFGTGEEFLYFKCSKCGCLQIETIPDDMSQYYPDNYYSYSTEIKAKAIKSEIVDFLLKNAIAARLGKKKLIGRMAMLYNPYYRNQLFYLDNIDKGYNAKILDIGCGAGTLLNYMHTIGFKYLTGIDPYLKEHIHYDNGVVVWKKNISEISETYDFVMLHHSFEHMPEPRDVFSYLYKILSHDGMVLIRIPLVDGYAWRKYGMNWFQVDAPRHFFLHTVQSVSLLARTFGFGIEKIEYDSTYAQIVNSEKYLQNIPLVEEQFVSVDFLQTAEKKAKELNVNRDGDQACFYLRKLLH